MAEIIGLPKLSPTMEEGVLVKWLKQPGDHVEPGDLVAEVETDKANMDFTMEDEGVLLALLVAEGDTVALGDPVAILGEAGEDVSALIEQAKARSGKAGAAGAPAASAPKAAPTSAVSPAPAAPAATPTPPAMPAPAAAPEPTAASATGGRILASPLAKTLAIELGIDLRKVRGTGPGGRIVERDVRAFADQGAPAVSAPPPAAPAPAQTPAYAPPSTGEPAVADVDTALALVGRETAGLVQEGEYRDEPLSNVRKRIAERLTAGKRDVPHFYLTRSFDAAPLLSFRKRLNELLGDRGRVSVNDLIIKGVALALRQMPECNASFIGDAIRYHKSVHIGVAVAIDQGLITPVVRNADLKGIGVIASEVKDLAVRARERRLKMHEIQGSTFTISNLGMFGIEHFTAIINPPEAGILAVGAVVDTPVVKDGELAVGKRMTMTMSCDHRVIDGALGARFLQVLIELLEQPESLAL